jgi:hypothetical protein
MEQAIRDTEETFYKANRAAIAQLLLCMLASAETGPDVSILMFLLLMLLLLIIVLRFLLLILHS